MKPTPAELASIAATLATTHKGDTASLMARAQELWEAAHQHLTPKQERHIAFYDFLTVALPTPKRKDEKRKVFMDYLLATRAWPSGWAIQAGDERKAAQSWIDQLQERGIALSDAQATVHHVAEFHAQKVSRNRAAGGHAKAEKAQAKLEAENRKRRERELNRKPEFIRMDATAAEEMNTRQRTGIKPRRGA